MRVWVSTNIRVKPKSSNRTFRYIIVEYERETPIMISWHGWKDIGLGSQELLDFLFYPPHYEISRVLYVYIRWRMRWKESIITIFFWANQQQRPHSGGESNRKLIFFFFAIYCSRCQRFSLSGWKSHQRAVWVQNQRITLPCRCCVFKWTSLTLWHNTDEHA